MIRRRLGKILTVAAIGGMAWGTGSVTSTAYGWGNGGWSNGSCQSRGTGFSGRLFHRGHSKCCCNSYASHSSYSQPVVYSQPVSDCGCGSSLSQGYTSSYSLGQQPTDAPGQYSDGGEYANSPPPPPQGADSSSQNSSQMRDSQSRSGSVNKQSRGNRSSKSQSSQRPSRGSNTSGSNTPPPPPGN